MWRNTRLFLLPALLAGLAHAPAVLAVACTSIANTNWNVQTTWGAAGTGCAGAVGGIPGAADTVTINTNVTVTAAVTVGAVTSINAGRTLTVNGVNFIVNGATTISGTIAHPILGGTHRYIGLVTINAGGIWTNAGNNPVNFRGGIAHNGATFTNGTGAATFTTASRTISGGSAMTFGGAVTVTGAIVIDRTNTNTITIAGVLNGSVAGSTWQNNAGTLNYSAGAVTAPMNIGVLTANANPNTVIYSRGGAQNIKATTYHHLQLSGSGAKTALAGLTVNGDLTWVALSSATFTAGAFTHNFLGNWVVNTTAAAPLSVATTSLINFNTPGTPAATSVGGTTAATLTFADVTINNTSGVTFNENASFSAGTTPTLTVAAGATLTPAAAVIISGTGTLTGNGTVQVTRTAATPDFLTQYTIATKTLTNLTVDYSATAAQTVNNLAYGHLRLSGSGVKTMPAAALAVSGNFTMAGTAQATAGGAMTVGGNFDVGAGTTFSASSFTHNLAGNFLRSGTFNANTSTFNFNGTVPQALTGTVTFNHLTISNTTAPMTANNDITVNGNVANSGTHTGAGRIILSGGSAVHQLSGNGTYGGLELNDALGALLTGSPTVAGTLTFTSGLLTTGSINTLTIGSAGNVTGAAASRHIVGNLVKVFSAAASFAYDVGDGTNYTPLAVTFDAPVTGNLTAAVTNTDHPNTTGVASGIDASKSINRYWMLKNSTISGTYSAALTYIDGTPVDRDSGAAAASFVIRRGATCSGSGGGRTCASWGPLTLSGVPSNTLATATGISISSGDPEFDFVVGEVASTRFTREKEFIYTRELY